MRQVSDESLPASDDPLWEEWCAPLVAFLSVRGRQWSALREWARNRDIGHTRLMNLLAWLDLKGRAKLKKVKRNGKEVWIWKVVQDEVPAVAHPPDHCPRCSGTLIREDASSYRCVNCSRYVFL